MLNTPAFYIVACFVPPMILTIIGKCSHITKIYTC